VLKKFCPWVIGCAAVMALSSGQAIAQTTAAEIQTEAEAALVGGDPAQTVILANQLLEDNPGSFAALFLLALAQSDLDLPREAAASASRAYRAAPNEETRLQTARLAATAHFRAEQFARSEFWFRRAANHIATEDDAEAIVRGFQRAREANPITTQFTASFAPSDNINDGSNGSRLCFEFRDGSCVISELEPGEESFALSGYEYGASARFEYRLNRSQKSETSVGALLFGSGVIFSDETEDLLSASEIEETRALTERDFSAVLTQISLSQIQTELSPFGPTRTGINYGRYWLGGELLVVYADLILAQIIPVRQDAAWTIETSVREQRAVASGILDSTIYEASLAYRFGWENSDTGTVTLSSKHNDTAEESSFLEYQLRYDHAFDQKFASASWSTFAEIGYRSFEEFFFTLDGRRDRLARLGVTAVFEETSYFGFSPSVSLVARRTDSDFSFSDSSEVSLSFGIASNF